MANWPSFGLFKDDSVFGGGRRLAFRLPVDSSWAADVLSTRFIVLLRKTNQSRYFGS